MRRLIPFLVLAMASCSPSNPPQPVHGQVFFRDRPAEGAVVTLVPQSENPQAPRPSGIVGKDGAFKLSTAGAFDGAPVGKYAVTIFYLSPEKRVDDQNAGPDLLQGRYRDPRTTPLKVEIKHGANELEPFRLK